MPGSMSLGEDKIYKIYKFYKIYKSYNRDEG